MLVHQRKILLDSLAPISVQMQRFAEVDALCFDDADGLSRHDAPDNKKPSWLKRELGGPRFSSIFHAPRKLSSNRRCRLSRRVARRYRPVWQKSMHQIRLSALGCSSVLTKRQIGNRYPDCSNTLVVYAMCFVKSGEMPNVR